MEKIVKVKKKLLDLAYDNAKIYYEEKLSLMLEKEENLHMSMRELADLFDKEIHKFN